MVSSLIFFHVIFVLLIHLYMEFQVSNLNFIWKHEWRTIYLNIKNSYQDKIIDFNLEIHVQIDQKDENDVKKK